ncbi:MAG: hypothetical protein QM270_07055 [Bacillota bacterium]|nr:hypothetical protein [Bacillota bacterium]
MAYIDAAYYAGFTGQPAPADFTQLEQMASRLINSICGNQIGEKLDDLPDEDKPLVKDATAAQVAYMAAQGGMAALLSSSGGANKVTIGRFSYDSTAGAVHAGIPVSPLLASILWPTGMLFRGAGL